MSERPTIPVHQELRTAPPLRPLALVANAAIIDVVAITFWLSFTSGMYASTGSMMRSAAIEPPRWVSPVAYAFVLPLLLPVLLRLRWNRRKIRRTIDGLCAKRDRDERAPARRVYWRRDDPGAWRGPALANPVWSPAERAEGAQSSEQRPVQRRSPALLLGIAAGAGCAALLNFFSTFGPLEIAVPVLIVLIASLLSARTTPGCTTSTRPRPTPSASPAAAPSRAGTRGTSTTSSSSAPTRAPPSPPSANARPGAARASTSPRSASTSWCATPRASTRATPSRPSTTPSPSPSATRSAGAPTCPSRCPPPRATACCCA